MIEAAEGRAKEARDKAFYDASVLLQTYGWDQNSDVRITTIGKIIRLLISLQFSLNCLRRLQDAGDEVWSELLLPGGQNLDRLQYLLVHELVTKTGFVGSLFA